MPSKKKLTVFRVCYVLVVLGSCFLLLLYFLLSQLAYTPEEKWPVIEDPERLIEECKDLALTLAEKYPNRHEDALASLSPSRDMLPGSIKELKPKRVGVSKQKVSIATLAGIGSHFGYVVYLDPNVDIFMEPVADHDLWRRTTAHPQIFAFQSD